MIFRMGQSLKFQGNHDDAVNLLERLYEPRYSRYPWVADGILRVGVWSFNETQDYEAGLDHYKHVYTNYPESEDAELALFYYGFFSARAGKHRQAVRAFREYVKRYPDQLAYKRVKNELLPDSERKLNRGDHR